jgi:hypothetical protein
LAIATAAYNAVWQVWPGLNAENVETARKVAMAAAIKAYETAQK